MASRKHQTKPEKKAAERGLGQSVDLASSMSGLSVQAGTIGDHPRLISAMDRFCSENSHFESSTVGTLVRDEMASATDINHAALVPLRHKIFGFDVALKWGFFLMQAVPRILSEDGGSLQHPFDIARYNSELVTIYDLAVESAVWDLCEEEVDEDDEDDGSEEQ